MFYFWFPRAFKTAHRIKTIAIRYIETGEQPEIGKVGNRIRKLNKNQSSKLYLFRYLYVYLTYKMFML